MIIITNKGYSEINILKNIKITVCLVVDVIFTLRVNVNLFSGFIKFRL